MAQKHPRYISVVGPTIPLEVAKVVYGFRSAGIDEDPLPVIGIQSSQRTVRNSVYVSNNLRFPRYSDIPTLLNPGANIVLHYNPHNDQPDTEESLSYQLANALSGLDVWGVQVNGKSWPAVSDLEAVREEFDYFKIILQLSKSMMDSLSFSQVAGRIRTYGDSIDYILIDPSRGRGLPFDVDHSCSLYDEIRSLFDYGVVFAGGFSADNVAQRLETLADRLGSLDFSIDAEGNLRDKRSDRFGDDILNIEKVRGFLEGASSVYFG